MTTKLLSPDTLIDVNIASDYGKIRRLFSLGKSEHHQIVLEELIETGSVEGLLTQQFSFEKEFSKDDFISLLFYLGLVSIHQARLSRFQFYFPNYVIKELYLEFFIKSLKEQYQLNFEIDDVRDKLEQSALNTKTTKLKPIKKLRLDIQ